MERRTITKDFETKIGVSISQNIQTRETMKKLFFLLLAAALLFFACRKDVTTIENSADAQFTAIQARVTSALSEAGRTARR